MNRSLLFNKRHPLLIKISENQKKSLFESKFINSRVEYIHSSLEGDLLKLPKDSHQVNKTKLHFGANRRRPEEKCSEKVDAKISTRGVDSTSPEKEIQFEIVETLDYRKLFLRKNQESNQHEKHHLTSERSFIESGSQDYCSLTSNFWKSYNWASEEASTYAIDTTFTNLEFKNDFLEEDTRPLESSYVSSMKLNVSIKIKYP